jgi:hypothetical protein
MSDENRDRLHQRLQEIISTSRMVPGGQIGNTGTNREHVLISEADALRDDIQAREQRLGPDALVVTHLRAQLANLEAEARKKGRTLCRF